MKTQVIEIPPIELSWSPWTPWQRLVDDVAAGGAPIPDKPGVYAVRRSDTGECLYIGKSSYLYRRVKQGLVRGKVEHPGGVRIRTEEKDTTKIEVRWALTDRPSAVEEELYRQYRLSHDGAMPKYARNA